MLFSRRLSSSRYDSHSSKSKQNESSSLEDLLGDNWSILAEKQPLQHLSMSSEEWSQELTLAF